MCQTAAVRKGRQMIWCDTLGELSKATGIKVARIPHREMPSVYRPSWNGCLCHVDFEKLAVTIGATAEPPNWGDGHYGEVALTFPSIGRAAKRG